MARELKLWNGRGNCLLKSGDPMWDGFRNNAYAHGYVAAYSRSDARRVIAEYCGRDPGDAELRVYWNSGCWGNPMDGIAPERGLWIDLGKGPVRVI